MRNFLKSLFTSKSLDYDTFAPKCVEQLKAIQDKFYKEYSINDYTKWFYNQSTGLMTFSSEEREVNFRYFSVGSFSTKTNTWKWSWDNSSTMDNVKEQIESVKEFGIKYNYPKLAGGYFESNEVEAWEFAAIALKVAGGIGVYRPVDENLQLYFVVTEFIDNETAQVIKDKYIDCAKHDFNRIAFVCQHIIGKEKVGFEEAFETHEGMELGEDDDFQAWCNECETIRQQQDGWTDDAMAFADIKVVCEECYFEKKELNLGYR